LSRNTEESTMGLHPRHRPDGLAHVSDEDLVLRAREGVCVQDELLARYQKRIARVVACVVRAVWLPERHWDDAGQVGLLALVEAIADYREPAVHAARQGRFGRFLCCLVNRHVRNHAKSVHRHEQHYSRDRNSGLLANAIDPAADPAHLAERRELVALLVRRLADLPPWERRLVETLVSRGALRQLAAEVGRDYEELKRQRWGLVLRLRRDLLGPGE
jgi:hypothetical protein